MASAQAVGATGPPRVLLIPLQRGEGVSSVVPGRVFEYLRTIIEMNDGLEIMVPETLEKPKADDLKILTAPETEPGLLKADDTLWSAKELAASGKHLVAAKRFNKAVKAYKTNMAELVDFDKYVDAMLGVALSFFYAGYDDNGEEALTPVLVLRPNLVLDKRKVPAAALASLGRLKLMYSRAETGSVSVEAPGTAPTGGAEVYLDGVLKGKAPVSFKGMLRGTHYIRVVADGFEPWSASVTASGKDKKLTAKMKRDAKAPVVIAADETLPEGPEGLIVAARTGAMGPGFLKRAEALADEFSLDTIVLTYIRSNDGRYELAPFVYDAKEKKVAELEWIHLDRSLSTMQVNLLILEEKLLQSFAVFPRSRILAGTSEIYVKPVVVPEPTPMPEPVVVSPTVTPAPQPLPTPVVIQPGPAPKPVVVVKTEPKPEPKLPAPVVVVAPKPAPVVVVVTPKPAPRPAPVIVVVAPRPAPSPATGGTQVLDTKKGHQLGAWGRPVGTVPVVAPKPRPAPTVLAPTPRPTAVVTPRPTPTPTVRPRVNPALTTPPSKPVPTPFVEDDDAWYEQWWVWTLVGVGVAGIAGGAAAGVLLSGDDTAAQPGFRTTVEWGN